MMMPRQVNLSTTFNFLPSVYMNGSMYTVPGEGWKITTVLSRLILRPNALHASDSLSIKHYISDSLCATRSMEKKTVLVQVSLPALHQFRL